MFYYTKATLIPGNCINLTNIDYLIIRYEFRTNSQYCYYLKVIG